MFKYFLILIITFNIILAKVVKFERVLYVIDNIPKEELHITIINNSKAVINNYVIYLRKKTLEKVFNTKIYNNNSKTLLYNKDSYKDKYYKFTVFFNEEIKVNNEFKFVIKNNYLDKIEFRPKNIKIKQDQLIYYSDWIIPDPLSNIESFSFILLLAQTPENITTNLEKITSTKYEYKYNKDNKNIKKNIKFNFLTVMNK